MSSGYNFDDIRPYRDEEVQSVLQRLSKDPVFRKVLLQVFKTDEEVDKILSTFPNINSVNDFQKNYSYLGFSKIAEGTTKGLTTGGLDHLEKEQSYLFISNHRDIILDSGFLNIEMLDNGLNTTEIAIGSNLLIYQWIEDLVKINRSFVVKRDIPVKQMLEASKTLSAYIRQTISSHGDSIWIAQKEGRTKDGNDQTQIALLKMLNISNGNDFVTGFNELNIVPMGISYEIEPCGAEKVNEMIQRAKNPDFRKTQEDDLFAMAHGLKANKGRVHFSFGVPIKLDPQDFTGKNKNQQFKALKVLIDRRIYKNYKLWPNNYVAHDLKHNSDRHSAFYTQKEKQEFIGLMHDRLSQYNIDNEEGQLRFIDMYAMPLINFKKHFGSLVKK